MANTWGSLAWSVGNFGEQSNATVALTGIGLEVAQGNESITATVDFGWSNNAWGEVSWNTNEIDAVAFPTGIQLNTALGDETVAGEINTGWGRSPWGEFGWGIAGSVLTTGQQLNLNLNSVTTTADAVIIPTGSQLNFEGLGTVTFDIGATIELTGQQLELDLGEESVEANADIVSTGIALETALGEVESYNEIGWGRDGWGEEAWGAAGIWATVSLTGIGLEIAQGNETSQANAEVNPTGLTAAFALSSVDASPDAFASGNQTPISLGDAVIEANADVVITGIGLEIAQGQAGLDANTQVNITGIGLENSLGTVFAGGSTDISVTGLDLTLALGNEVSQVWTIVDTGTSVAYTEVSTGITVTWNDVDTAA